LKFKNKKLLTVLASLILATALIAKPQAGGSTFSIYGDFGINLTGGQVIVSPGDTAETKSDIAYGFGALFG